MPAPVSGGHSWRAIAAGGNTTCGVTTAGRAMRWGRGNNGQLGDGSMTERAGTPVAVSGEATYSRGAVGTQSACAISADGSAVWCWGRNHRGQLGNGTVEPSATPVRVAFQ